MPIFKPQDLTTEEVKKKSRRAEQHGRRCKEILQAAALLWDAFGERNDAGEMVMHDPEMAEILTAMDELAHDENVKALQTELEGALVFAGRV